MHVVARSPGGGGGLSACAAGVPTPFLRHPVLDSEIANPTRSDFQVLPTLNPKLANPKPQTLNSKP